MTRAPLPGKLPEWPEKPPQWIGGTFAVYQAECIVYWESRARLMAADLENIARNAWPAESIQQIAMNSLKAIGPFPEEDRT